jgi:hypothetical protein
MLAARFSIHDPFGSTVALIKQAARIASEAAIFWAGV